MFFRRARSRQKDLHLRPSPTDALPLQKNELTGAATQAGHRARRVLRESKRPADPCPGRERQQACCPSRPQCVRKVEAPRSEERSGRLCRGGEKTTCRAVTLR